MEKPTSKKEFRELCRISISYHMVYCYLCGQIINPEDDWNLDHVRPKSKGGITAPYNLRPVHKECNTKRGNMPLKTWFLLQKTKQK